MDNITIVETFSALLLLSKSRKHLSCHIYRTCARRGASSLCSDVTFFTTAQKVNAKTPQGQINRKHLKYSMFR